MKQFIPLAMILSMFNACTAMDIKVFEESLVIKAHFNKMREERAVLKTLLTRVQGMQPSHEKSARIDSLRKSFKSFHANAIDSASRCSAHHIKFARRYKAEAKAMEIMAGSL